MHSAIRRLSMISASMNSKPLRLYTAQTPNGHQVSVLLEELKAVYGPQKIDYDVEDIDLFGSDKPPQKEPWFLKLNPNGRIPVLTDHKRNDFHVFETAAILLYLAQHYDSDHHFWFNPTSEPDNYSQMLQWIFFAHGGVGPMQGQANHFVLSAPEKIPYAITRYTNETKRLYKVLDGHLANRDWLAGAGPGKYSLADMKAFPWVRRHSRCGIETLDEWPNVKAWVARAEARPAAQAGLKIPEIKESK